MNQFISTLMILYILMCFHHLLCIPFSTNCTAGFCLLEGFLFVNSYFKVSGLNLINPNEN